MAEIASFAEIASQPVAAPAAEVGTIGDAAFPPPKPQRSGWAWLPIASASLAVLASSLSVVGLMVASRTVAAANHAVADLRESQQAIVKLAAATPIESAGQALPTLPTETVRGVDAAATPEDIRRALDDLRADLARYQAPGGGLLISTLRDGQAELANRIGEIALRLDRIERAINSSRAARP